MLHPRRGQAPRAQGDLSRLLLLALVAVSCAGCTDGRAEADLTTGATPLRALYESPEALARSFLDALERGDVEKLRSFALTEDEFRRHVWPRLPSSRPERGVPFEYGWADLNQKSHSSLRRTYARYQGRPLSFLEIRFEDETTDYGAFLVHRDARVRVRDEEGRTVWLDLFGSVMEWNGKFKLFSYVTD